MPVIVVGRYDGMYAADATHIARHDPARVLAECAAKRAIVSEHRQVMFTEASLLGIDNLPACKKCHTIAPAPDGWPADEDWTQERINDSYPCRTLRLLAQPYADHSDFDPAWRSP